MAIEFRPIDDSTRNDAECLIRQRFPISALSVFDKVMRNPIAKGLSKGVIAYKDGVPICMQESILRKLYFKKSPFFGVVGGMTCKVQNGCPLRVLLECVEKAEMPINDSRIFYGNTCRKETAGFGDVYDNVNLPESTTRFLWRPIRLFTFICYIIRRKLLKLDVPHWKVFKVDSREFTMPVRGTDITIRSIQRNELVVLDDFMERYLVSNDGIVGSRSSEEIDWVYGNGLECGKVVMLGAFKSDSLVGYIIVKTDDKARRWIVGDLIAIGNESGTIHKLLKASCEFLKQKTPAMLIECIGFPDWIQATIKQVLSYENAVGHNVFRWRSEFSEVRELLSNLADFKSWFFGPYDGDMCLDV